jgi:hypothetical protein
MPLILAGPMIEKQQWSSESLVIGAKRVAGKAGKNRAFGTGIAVAIIASLMTIWTTIVRDDGNGASFFMLIMAAMVGAFAAKFRPAGMARTMVGVAVMQMLLGTLIATAPVTANLPLGPLKALLFSGGFAVLWLISAAFFRAAAKGQSSQAAPD